MLVKRESRCEYTLHDFNWEVLMIMCMHVQNAQCRFSLLHACMSISAVLWLAGRRCLYLLRIFELMRLDSCIANPIV